MAEKHWVDMKALEGLLERNPEIVSEVAQVFCVDNLRGKASYRNDAHSSKILRALKDRISPIRQGRGPIVHYDSITQVIKAGWWHKKYDLQTIEGKISGFVSSVEKVVLEYECGELSADKPVIIEIDGETFHSFSEAREFLPKAKEQRDKIKSVRYNFSFLEGDISGSCHYHGKAVKEIHEEHYSYSGTRTEFYHGLELKIEVNNFTVSDKGLYNALYSAVHK